MRELRLTCFKCNWTKFKNKSIFHFFIYHFVNFRRKHCKNSTNRKIKGQQQNFIFLYRFLWCIGLSLSMISVWIFMDSAWISCIKSCTNASLR